MADVAAALRCAGKQLQVLLIIDLDSHEPLGAILALEGERLRKSQEIFIKRACLGQVALINRYMRDTQDMGLRIGLRKQRRGKQDYRQEANQALCDTDWRSWRIGRTVHKEIFPCRIHCNLLMLAPQTSSILMRRINLSSLAKAESPRAYVA